jgi:PKHD-type hydroxylase
MELYFIPNLFDEDELKIIDDAISDDQWEQAGVGYLTQKPEARSTKIKWIESEILNKKLGQSFEDANKIYNFQITELSDIGILKYNVGDYYNKHIDMAGTADMKAGFPSRKISLIVPLSNDYEGGDTLFHKEAEPILMKKEYNTGTFFPSYVLHEVTPIEKGTRYSLVVWALGDPFK